MKTNKIFRWLWRATALTLLVFVMQACLGFSFDREMRRDADEIEEVDTTVSEDLQFSGFDNEDWQSGDDPVIP